jgi:hypothetical protein
MHEKCIYTSANHFAAVGSIQLSTEGTKLWPAIFGGGKKGVLLMYAIKCGGFTCELKTKGGVVKCILSGLGVKRQ